MTVRVQPSPLATVEVPRFLSPSAITSFDGCRLKMIASAKESRLSPGPEASLGRLHHRLLEAAATGGMPARGTATATAEQLFDEELARLNSRLRVDPETAHRAPIEQTRSPRRWLEFRARTLRQIADRLEEAGSGSGRGAVGRREGGGAREPLGAEVPLESARLRLRGRADAIERARDGVLTVRDFKTGRVLDDQGKVRSSIELQLRLYGVMCVDVYGVATIKLVADDGVAHEVKFSDQERRECEESLLALLSDLVPGEVVKAEDLAKVGDDCFSCGIRPACAAYLSRAPAAWQDGGWNGEWKPPRDIWGAACEVAVRGPAWHVKLRDAAGRLAKVVSLDCGRHPVGGIEVGTRLWMFDLEAEARRGGAHPRNFYELPENRWQRRAWRLRIFRARD